MPKTPPEVRILPMDSRKEFEGKKPETVQQEFFLQRLPLTRNGFYWYHKHSLQAESGTVVLFQYHGQVIASAVYTHSIPFDSPQWGYNGGLHFDANSIRVFKPMNAEKL